jgi:hypothetical protein
MWARVRSQLVRIRQVLLYYDKFIRIAFTQFSSSIYFRVFSSLDDIQLWPKYVTGHWEKWLRKHGLSDDAALIIY